MVSCLQRRLGIVNPMSADRGRELNSRQHMYFRYRYSLFGGFRRAKGRTRQSVQVHRLTVRRFNQRTAVGGEA